ncbi:autotransporter outer membrane beta-barrel domain-containing protein [Fulvivirga ulvae]|uniref:autotransporter domain-containing protein n=1 Tax=Fulvivirga ulvae TaxID=2904245 RepID=UPI001F2EAE51|nr:autotransporter domain-containing protein [Fulvivirga ulvae]UII31429.1 autotransporter outer membrane beta-barrel domain-containing protein [Fulvivirga ulvae]
MKNKAMLISILLISFIQFELHSQERLQKGNYYIGGGIGFSTRDESLDDDDLNASKYDYMRYSLSPYSGKFIKDGLAIGLNLQISSTDLQREQGTIDNLQVTKEDGFSIGAGIFLKKYWPVSEKFGAYLIPSLSYSRSHDESKNTSNTYISSSESTSNQINLSTGLGLYYFISPRFSLETNLANVVLSKQFLDKETRNTSTEDTLSQSLERNNLDFNLINQFSFDQIIVINYYF